MATAGENLGPVLLKSMWVGVAVVSATMVIRFYVRARLVAKISPDDWIMLLAYALISTESGLDTAAVHNGYGQHQWLLDEAHVSPAAKWNIIAQAVGILGVAIARIAFATMLMEILSPQQRVQRTFLWIIITSQLLINFSLSILILTQCRPTQKLWDKAVDGHCLPREVQEYFGFMQGSTSALTDLCLAALPSTIIWKLNMKLSTRISLSMVMGLGVFAMVGSIMRTIYLTRLTQVDDYTCKSNRAREYSTETALDETTYLVLWFKYVCPGMYSEI
ncbi:MAG: hypothetical protein LQ349_005588 [Xanthoria aureola]|nr:MAG: hypothetical protein LQ349_005588 [Xanthoria aureola]